MGRVKVTEKPGVWPYVLVNDFKSSPYFAYEHVDENGNRSFVRVLTAGPQEEAEQNSFLTLTQKRKVRITKFLKEVLKTPSKYGEFMSQEWIQQLVKFLDLFDEQTIEAYSHIVEEWLKNEVFKNLMKEIRERIAAAKAKVSEESATSASSSQKGQKRQAPEEDSSSDDDSSSDSDSLFTPFIVRVKRKQGESKMD